MRRSERRANALAVLLLLAGKGSVTISGRGIDEQGRPLYQITQYGGGIVCQNANEEELTRSLLQEEVGQCR